MLAANCIIYEIFKCKQHKKLRISENVDSNIK